MKNQNHIIFIVFNLFLFSFLAALGKNEKPNLVIILADDLGYADLGIHGSRQIPTPHIDQFGKEGIVFSGGNVSSPVCSPSRAGLLTRKNQLTFGYNNNLGPNQTGFDPEFAGLTVKEITLADKLKALGYTTGLMGKWHLGEKPQFFPTNRGFDEFWGFLGSGLDYVTPNLHGTGMVSPIHCNYKTPEPLTYMTDDIGNECIGFIKRHKNDPFFLFASFNAPHSPMQITEEEWTLYEYIEKTKKKFQVVYFLHGDRKNKTKYAAGFLDGVKKAINEGILPLGICIFPNRGMSGNRNEMEMGIIEELIPKVDKNFRTLASPKSRAMAGFSKGGGDSVNPAIKHPVLFSAAASMGDGLRNQDGELNVSIEKSIPVWKKYKFGFFFVNPARGW